MNLSVSIAVLDCDAIDRRGFAGCVTASYVSGDSGQTLSEYVNQYVSLLGAGRREEETSFPGRFFNLYQSPLLSFLFGFTALSGAFS